MTKDPEDNQQNPTADEKRGIGYDHTHTNDEEFPSSAATNGDSAPSEPVWENHVGGELQREISVPKSVVDVLEEALGTLNIGKYEPVLQHGMAHTWHCQTRHAHRYARGVPISHGLWRWACVKHEVPVPSATKSIWGPAYQAGLLHVTRYTYRGKNPQSREFLIPEDLCSQMILALEDGGEQKTRYNLVSGDRLYGTYSTQTTYDGTHSWKDRSPFMYDVLKRLKGQRDLVNRAAVEAHLDNVKRNVHLARKDHGYRWTYLAEMEERILPFNDDLSEVEESVLKNARKEVVEHFRKLKRLHLRHLQDRRIWDDIVSQGLEEAEDQPSGIFEYETAYEVQEASGRLTMICGLQNASEEMKAAAAEGIPKYSNYDIASSQTHALIMELEKAVDRGAALDVSIFVEYEENGGKDGLEEEWGIGRERWKTPEHAVKFGAVFQETLKAAKGVAVGKIAEEIGDEDGDFQFEMLHAYEYESGTAVWDRAVLNKLPTMAAVAHNWAEDSEIQYNSPEVVYGILKEAYGAMAEQLEAWREWLIDEYWPEVSENGGQGTFVKNPCGLTFSIHDSRLAEGDRDEPNRYEKKKGFTTSLLQGREAAFVHALTLLQDQYEYEFLRNEHDGGVVIGEIPDGAIQDARERSGFDRAELERKPFKL